MKHLVAARGVPESITTDNGSEFAGQAMDAWAHQAGVKLDFIRPGRPVQNGLHVNTLSCSSSAAVLALVRIVRAIRGSRKLFRCEPILPNQMGRLN